MEDRHTSTVDGAAAFERGRGMDEDFRPTARDVLDGIELAEYERERGHRSAMRGQERARVSRASIAAAADRFDELGW